MIVKYKHEGNWGFIDGLSNVVKKDICQNELMDLALNGTVELVGESVKDAVNSNDPTHIKIHNSIFLLAADRELKELGDAKVTQKPLLTENLLPTVDYDYSAIVVLANLKDREEFDKILLVCNDEVYLMNDQGVTIERLN